MALFDEKIMAFGVATPGPVGTSLHGVVTNEKTGDPIEGALVMLYVSKHIAARVFTYTDSSGYYEFTDLPPETYVRWLAQATNYGLFDEPITLIEGIANEQNIALIPLEGIMLDGLWLWWGNVNTAGNACRLAGDSLYRDNLPLCGTMERELPVLFMFNLYNFTGAEIYGFYGKFVATVTKPDGSVVDVPEWQGQTSPQTRWLNRYRYIGFMGFFTLSQPGTYSLTFESFDNSGLIFTVDTSFTVG